MPASGWAESNCCIQETVDVTLATDDDKQLEAHNKDFIVEETMVKKNGYPNKVFIHRNV
jgi:hypothetical protein